MAPKPNGFYMFMLEEQKKIQGKGGRAPSMREMPTLCKDRWKQMSAEEKKRYDAKAKGLSLQGGASVPKYDCLRNPISERKDPVKEEIKRRTMERQKLSSLCASTQDIKDMLCHIIDFQVMYDDIMVDQHLPLEIGMVSFTLRKGVVNFLHRFINPGNVPQGNRHMAVSHSENSHQIPLDFEHADANLKHLTDHMTEFLLADSNKDEVPPIYCLSIHRRLVENCLDYIYSREFVSESKRVKEVFCLEDLVSCLISNSGKAQKTVADSQVNDMLRVNRWDYNNKIRCFYHEEQDCSFCSLSIVRRYSFAIFDVLASLLEFDLTDKHMPDELEEIYTVTQSFGFGRSGFGASNNNHRGGDDRTRVRRPYMNNVPQADPPNHNAWQPPRVNPVQIPLKDEEDEEDDDDEEEEEDIQPKQEYSLKKMRLPKSIAQAQVQGQSDKTSSEAPTGPTPFSSNSRMPSATGAPNIPMGRGLAPSKRGQQPQPTSFRGRGMIPPTVQPPPGFGAKQLNEDFPSLSISQGRTRMDNDFPALGGVGRGQQQQRATNPRDDFPILGLSRGRARLGRGGI